MYAGSDNRVSSPQPKRARSLDVSDSDCNVSDQSSSPGSSLEDSFIQDANGSESESGGEDDDDDDATIKPSDKKAGKRKIKMKFIRDKRKRQITFSKRRAGIMEEAYELSTLTGTQVLLLVVSETGVIYTFTTSMLQPLVTQPEGQNLIKAYLNAPHGSTAKEAVAVDSANRLPVEILSEILLACAHTLDQSELDEMDELQIPPRHHGLLFAPNAAPYTVSSVCKRWRSIGLSTPKLWSKFTIPDPDCEVRNFMVALRTWLKRSKNQPLQLTCVTGEDVLQEVLIELSKNMHRWHTAYFGNWSNWASDYPWDWSRNNEIKAENLVTLEFDPCHPSLDIAFEQFPNLRRLRIHPDCLAAEEAGSLNLTHLTLTELQGNTATFFSYLRQFPSLISFEAPVEELEPHLNHTFLTTFTHTTLTELTITQCYDDGDDGVTFGDILTNIHLPSIRRLRLIYACECPSSEMPDIVNDFIRRHESTFTDFELSGLWTSSDEMLEILHMFPKYLTSYQSFLDDLTDKDVKRLTLDPLDPAQDLAPDLSSISLCAEGANGRPSGDLLAEMILSRWARNPRTMFKLYMDCRGSNPLSDSRIARRVRYSPGVLVFVSCF